MIPIVEIPLTIRDWMKKYREIFCRDAGFNHIRRYITGLILSSNKTFYQSYELHNQYSR